MGGWGTVSMLGLGLGAVAALLQMGSLVRKS